MHYITNHEIFHPNHSLVRMRLVNKIEKKFRINCIISNEAKKGFVLTADLLCQEDISHDVKQQIHWFIEGYLAAIM